ncbi:MAG: hypothetical protein P4M15_12650 [Alphaproteobacteria bacterium]|nr:hypothetical protein [Alphaproteobacteria bacterium]
MADALISINELWKTDRDAAIALYTQYDAEIRKIYSKEEYPYSLEKMIARFDRQNNVNGMGDKNPTSVWTSVLVRVENGKITEGRLSELYPQGTSVPTYDYAANGKISAELDKADLLAAKNPDNKTNMQGVPTSYNDETWRDVVANHFLGQAMEIDPSAATPDGFARVPITFMSPPQTSRDPYKRLDLCWRNDDGSAELTADSYDKIERHVFGFSKVCANEHVPDGTDLDAYVRSRRYYRSANTQLKALEAAAAGSELKREGVTATTGKRSAKPAPR